MSKARIVREVIEAAERFAAKAAPTNARFAVPSPKHPADTAASVARSDPRNAALQAGGGYMDLGRDGEELWLHNIDVPSENRGKGLASGALRAILEAADTAKVPVALEVGAFDAPFDLIEWYSRHGFNWTPDNYMRREPAATPTALRDYRGKP